MPKVSGTRKQKAKELLETVSRGPSGLKDWEDPEYQGQTSMVFAHPKDQYRIWVDTWIIPVIKELVPELRKHV